MSMTKLILPGSYDFGESVAQMVKISSRGLIGHDLGTFIKRAGAKMADDMRKLSFAAGETPIHLLAIGATEFYGPNRNGDGFSDECDRKYHPTFVKHARWYRNHQNKDKSKSYGIVKHSSYNEDMRRIELIVALNGTKEAAKRNGGLLADREMEKLASNSSDWAVSMACKIAFDVCSMCGNKAKTKEDYCTGIEEGGKCPGGGCKNNLCKVAADGSITYVDNPHPTFFDISDVWRPADRIAFVLGPMQKAASGRVLGGAELANNIGLRAPFELEAGYIPYVDVRAQMKIAYDLANLETERDQFLLAPSRTVISGIREKHADYKRHGETLRALANCKIAMALPDFIQFATGRQREDAESLAHEIRPAIFGMFSKMCANTEKLSAELKDNQFNPARRASNDLEKWAESNVVSASLDPKMSQRRAWAQTINEQAPRLHVSKGHVKTSEAHEGIARAYCLYKIAFLHAIREQDNDFDTTMKLVLQQDELE